MARRQIAADKPESGESAPAKTFKVRRHLSHDGQTYKPGEDFDSARATPEQIKALLETKTIEEAAEEEAADEEEKKE